MITVYKIIVSKDRLRGMPKEERALFLCLGYAANQINVLFKLINFSLNKDPEGVEGILSAAQSQLLARIGIGLLHETYELIRKSCLSSSHGRAFVDATDTRGKEALERLKKYFGKDNGLTKLRNNYSFHQPYDIGVMDTAFIAAADDPDWGDDWLWFFSQSGFNSFYYCSDVVILHGMAETLGETGIIAAHKRIMGDVGRVSQDLTETLYSLTAAIWTKHFGETMEAEIIAEIPDAPKMSEFWIPFFVETEHDGAQTIRKDREEERDTTV